MRADFAHDYCPPLQLSSNIKRESPQNSTKRCGRLPWI
jgi:hypothetical protein